MRCENEEGGRREEGGGSEDEPGYGRFGGREDGGMVWGRWDVEAKVRGGGLRGRGAFELCFV